MTGTLILVRHGQSEWNLKNLFTGWRNPDLTAQGIEEARATITSSIATLGPDVPEAANPAKQLARALQRYHDASPVEPRRYPASLQELVEDKRQPMPVAGTAARGASVARFMAVRAGTGSGLLAGHFGLVRRQAAHLGAGAGRHELPFAFVVVDLALACARVRAGQVGAVVLTGLGDAVALLLACVLGQGGRGQQRHRHERGGGGSD